MSRRSRALTLERRLELREEAGLRDSDWRLLLSRIKNGACRPFLGAGTCVGTLPLGGEIAARWAEEHEYPLDDPHDLARVAQNLGVAQDDAMYPKELICADL